MQYSSNKTIICICITYFIFNFSIVLAHGFGANTLIELADDSKKTIYDCCLYYLRNTLSVFSYDISKNCNIKQKITIGKRSTSNCYIRLGFDAPSKNDNDILCTPTQEFYVTTYNKWVPAYLIARGDALLTKDAKSKVVTYKEFIPKSLKIYMLEVENTHTFFVSKYSLLTHNMLLPLTASIGFVVPFGSVATGTVGSFFGPVGIIGGIAIGGLCSIVIKALYEKRIPRYKSPHLNIAYIQNNCNKVTNENEYIAQPPGCFTHQNSITTSCIFPIENPLPSTSGCFEIEIHPANKQLNTCSKNEIEKVDNNGCFQQSEENKQCLYYSQEESSEQNKNTSRPKLTARNWKEFEENCPIGQKYGKKFMHTGKQNPKDGSPIRKLSEDIPNTEMFKRNYYFALDRFHDGDHFEVWDKREKWIGVANLDGSENVQKSNAEKNPNNRNLRKSR